MKPTFDKFVTIGFKTSIGFVSLLERHIKREVVERTLNAPLRSVEAGRNYKCSDPFPCIISTIPDSVHEIDHRGL
jgi:hypothetical protein